MFDIICGKYLFVASKTKKYNKNKYLYFLESEEPRISLFPFFQTFYFIQSRMGFNSTAMPSMPSERTIVEIKG